MSELSLTSLLKLQDDHLLALLKEIPNDILLSAVVGEPAMPVRQRVCEVLSISGAQVFLHDFAALPELSEEQCEASRRVIVQILFLHLKTGSVELNEQTTTRKLAS